MKKIIYIYWGQKFINAPMVVKNCLLSWKIKNPTWKVIELDDDNLCEYINIEDEIPNINNKNIKKAAYSDIIRIFLLAKYGGLWCDATTYCIKPLDDWLNEYISKGFFCLRQMKGIQRLICSYFLYGEENNYIIQKWKEMTVNFWKEKDETRNYFWFHFLFNKLYMYDNKFKNLWNLTPKQTRWRSQLLSKATPEKIEKIDNIIPFYKCTYKYDEKKYTKSTILYYLMNKINLRLIHIGKTGGTSVKNKFKLKQYHLNRNYFKNENEYYIIWIRNPLKRFVSAFYMSYNLINMDTSNLNINNLTLKNCLAPGRVRFKMTHNNTFSERYDYLINYFKTPNELAESITSENIDKKKLALELMNSKKEHIFKGIGWYMYDGDFIKKNHDKIIFVGTCENMDDDIKRLSNLLNYNISNSNKIRENSSKANDKFLSSKAIKNLIDFYNTDYKALKELVNYNFISQDIYESYFSYFHKC